MTLEQNYRSTQPILDVTNTLISRAPERYTKNLWTQRVGTEAPWLVTARDEQQQTRFVVDRILELHEDGTPLREIAVLVRAGYMSADLEIELTNRKIPFEKWGGLKFLEAAHVKDVLAFLRVIENPRDEVSWYRILMLLPGIGDITARAMMASMAESGWDTERVRALRAAAARARRAPRPRRKLLRRLQHARVAARAESAKTSTRFARSTTPFSPNATIAPSLGSPISISCASSPPATRIARRFSPRSPSSRPRTHRTSPAAASPRTTRSSSARCTARRERSGTRCSSSGRSTDGFRRRDPPRTRTSSRRSAGSCTWR